MVEGGSVVIENDKIREVSDGDVRGEIRLRLAISQGLMDGPRLYYGGKSLSQTGGVFFDAGKSTPIPASGSWS